MVNALEELDACNLSRMLSFNLSWDHFKYNSLLIRVESCLKATVVWEIPQIKLRVLSIFLLLAILIRDNLKEILDLLKVSVRSHRHCLLGVYLWSIVSLHLVVIPHKGGLLVGIL